MIVDRYVVAKNLAVKGLTTYQPDIIFGFAMPTAVAGFAYKLLLDFKAATGREINMNGTAVIVHEHRVLEGQAKQPPKDGETPAPFAFDLRADATVSFVFAVEADDNQIAIDDFVDFLGNAAIGANFGGGKIFPTSIPLVDSVTEIEDLQRIVGRGYVLLDRADMFENYKTSSGVDSLDALLDIVELVKQNTDAPENEEPAYTRRLKGWLVGINAGYQAINNPVLRARTRITDGSTKHVFAETIYSLGEYKSIAAALRDEQDILKSRAFWRHCHDPRTQTFFVSASNH